MLGSRGKAGKRTIPRKRVVVGLIGSPRFTTLQTVQAIVSCLRDRSLRAGDYPHVANREPEAWRRGGGEGSGSPAARCPRPACHLGAECAPLPRLISHRQGARRRRAVAMAFLECHKCPGSIQIDLCETRPWAKQLPIYSQQLAAPDNRTHAGRRRGLGWGKGGRRAPRAEGGCAKAAVSRSGGGKQEVVSLNWVLRTPPPCVVLEAPMSLWMGHRKAIHSICSEHLW